MNPLLKIQGSKRKISKWIVSNIKDNWDNNGIYFEPFAGSAIVGFTLLPNKAVFSDINGDIINFYNEIKKLDIDLIIQSLYDHGLDLMEEGEGYYYKVRDRFNKEKNILDFYFLNKTCFNGVIRYNQKGEFNTPFCKNINKFNGEYIGKCIVDISKFIQLCNKNKWLFIKRPYNKIIAKTKPNDFIYFDPPYVNRENIYLAVWRHEEEKHFHRSVRKTKAKWAVSTWKESYTKEKPISNKYFTFWKKDFKILTKEHKYRVGPNKNTRPNVTECLILK